MIEATGLSKRYGATLAVDDLSFAVPPGQVTGFLGPNGAGKSTTMRLILGLDAPTSGSVTVNGRAYAEYRRPLFEVGALLEAKAAHGGRSARNHLLCLALIIGRGRLIAQATVEDFLGGGSGNFVRVRSPQGDALATLLKARGAAVVHQADGALSITGADCAAVGELARANGITLRELSAHQASLEERYMELTRDSVDYRTTGRALVPGRN